MANALPGPLPTGQAFDIGNDRNGARNVGLRTGLKRRIMPRAIAFGTTQGNAHKTQRMVHPLTLFADPGFRIILSATDSPRGVHSMSIAVQPASDPAIAVHPFSGGFAAEISGISLSTPVSAADFAVIRRAFLDHKVLVFRNQPLDDEAQLAFGALFGSLDGHINRQTRHRTRPQVQVFSNLREDGSTTGVHPEKGTLVWHTDKSYTRTPSLTTILRSPAIASTGGDTLFADTARAWQELPATVRDRIGALRVVHDWKRSRERSGERPATGEEIAAAPPVEHPLVRTHPETGDRALYIGNHASHVVGLPADESEQLLKELEQHATQPQFVYRHKWQVNDVLMWDNRCTLHCVEPYDATVERRAVHRVVVKGDEPF